MAAGRSDMVILDPFFGSLALGLTVKVDPGCGTAYTDSRVLGFDPEYIETLNHAEVKGLFVHEVLHCAAGHCWRRDGRDPKQWNVACDLAINPIARDAGYTLPKGLLFPAQYGWDEFKTAEWYFARLQGKQSQNGDPNGDAGQDGNGDPAPGEVRDAPSTPDETGDPAPTESDWKQKVQEATNAAKIAGELSGGMDRAIQEAMRPRLDVKSLLIRFFTERAAADYNWARPSKRYLSQGLYLPALESKAMGEVAVMIDTSGSVDQTSLAYAAGIVQDVISECDPSGITLWFADSKVCNVTRLEKGDPLTWTPKGGGGTDFRPAIDAIDAAGDAVCIVCISDLDGTFPDVPPTAPVIWLSTDPDAIAPFGETVPIDR